MLYEWIKDKDFLISKEGKVYSKYKKDFLNPVVSKGGYIRYYMKRKMLLAHRVVAQHFIPNPNNYPEVNHIDGNKKNNHISNLEWCTRSQNSLHASKMGLNFRGEKNNKSKLKEKDVKDIIKSFKNGETTISLSKKYNVVRSAIYKIITRTTWRHLCLEGNFIDDRPNKK